MGENICMASKAKQGPATRRPVIHMQSPGAPSSTKLPELVKSPLSASYFDDVPALTVVSVAASRLFGRAATAHTQSVARGGTISP